MYLKYFFFINLQRQSDPVQSPNISNSQIRFKPENVVATDNDVNHLVHQNS